MKRWFCLWLAGSIMLVTFSAPSAAVENQTEQPRIGLALGSGGAVGLAHIAMLEVFDELKLKPERIVGTSIGAVIGALYSAGLSGSDIRAIFNEFAGSRLDALSRLVDVDSELTLGEVLEFDISNGGLLDPQGFLDFLADKVEARRFEELSIPLEVVATDYWTGQPVVLSHGDLFSAIKASMAVPGLFAPVKRNKLLLIDGGTSNPLPFDVIQGRCDLVVAIDVSGTRAPQENGRLGLTDVFFSTFEIMQQSLIARQMQAHKPQIYIKPATQNIRLLEFNRIKTILEQAGPAAKTLRRKLQAETGASPAT